VTTPQEGDVGPDLEKAKVRFEQLKRSNQEQLTAIAELGAELDPAVVSRLRIDTLVGFIFARLNTNPNVRQMLEVLFEIQFQENMAEMLKSVKSDVRKATLGLGASVPVSQWEEIWRREQQGGNGMPPGFGG
jgi:hypothetical protein